ncbi:glycosyltransferase family 32 protein [Enterocloster citroniae]
MKKTNWAIYAPDEIILDGAEIRPFFPIIPISDNFILTELSSDTIYCYSKNYIMTPFMVRTPPIQSQDPELFLFPLNLTDRYYFMAIFEKKWNFVEQSGFPRADILYDNKEKALFEYVIYNDDYIDKKPLDMGSKFVGNEVSYWQALNASDLLDDFKEGKLKGKLKEIAAGLDEESNPVIMIAKYKKRELNSKNYPIILHHISLFNLIDVIVMIPKKIHQIWEGRTENLRDTHQLLGETWKEYHPDWQYEFWDENRMTDLVYEHFPEMVDIYFYYPYNIQRWHVIRYMILYQFGGLYADFDYQCLSSFDKYIKNPQKCYFALESDKHQFYLEKYIYLNNSLMVAPPRHHFFEFIINEIQSASLIQYGDKYKDVLNSTGLMMLTNNYEIYNSKENITFLPAQLVTPLSKNEVKSYLKGEIDEEQIDKKLKNAIAIHYYLGSWMINIDSKQSLPYISIPELYKIFLNYPIISINDQSCSVDSLFFLTK